MNLARPQHGGKERATPSWVGDGYFELSQLVKVIAFLQPCRESFCGLVPGRGGSSFVPRLPTWTLLARLHSGEGAPSLFSSLLRRDEPGAPPPAAAEVAQASRSHSRGTTTVRGSCEEDHLTNQGRQEHTKKKGSRHSVEFSRALQDAQER
jgi:hypothetical protein